MKRIFLTVATVAIFFLTNYVTVAQFGFGGGKGTVNEPYQIRTKAHLEELADSINASFFWSKYKYFILMNDITDTVRTVIGKHFYNGRGFYGNFDGQSFKIVLGINNQSYAVPIGLFGMIGHCTISNLTVEGYVSSVTNYVGAIAGDITWVSQPERTVIKNCVNNCTVVGRTDVGGIVGNGTNCKIENCINNGNIIDNSDGIMSSYGSGGIVGNAATDVQIENCINNGNIKGLGRLGGIVGYYTASSERGDNPQHYIRNCINYGFVQGEANVGGIAGRVEHFFTDVIATVTNCINTGVITGKSETGCIIGYKSDRVTVENCYFDKQMCSGNGIGGE